MHSRIFQVSRRPIDKQDYIDESRYYEGFVGSIADYVDSMSDEAIAEAIESLKWVLGDAVEFKDRSFTVVDKYKFFAPIFANWLKQCRELHDVMDLESFSDDSMSLKMFGFSQSYNDKYDYYMDDNGEWAGNQTLMDFMRYAKEGDTFYLGNVIDYHF